MTSQPNTNQQKIGFLHPGQMGVTLAKSLADAGHEVCWASEGRSAATATRANDVQLKDMSTLKDMCTECTILLSVCPPDQATAVASQVAVAGFKGIYADCNAVSPASSQEVAKIVKDGGATFVDGGIIGPPATIKGTTRLYLSGQQSAQVADLFADTIVDARVVGPDIGSASALKMAYAGWTKGSWALLMTQFALAQNQNVESALLEEWALSQPGLVEKLRSAAESTAPKAWRFVGEMQEIANTLEEAGLSRQWFDGAADTYERLEGFKNRNDATQSEVIAALLKNSADL